jgi:polygalacturonase
MLSYFFLIPLVFGQIFDVRDFGAINDGIVHNNTLAFAAAVTAASAWFKSSGGEEQGIVIVQGGGIYMSGRIELLTGVSLNIASDTVLKASANVSDYSYGNNVWAFLYSSGANDFSITGGGIVNGNYEAFIGGFNETWDEFIPLTWPNCEGECRPRLAMLTDSTQIVIHNITFTGSPDWTFHLLNCTYVHVHHWIQSGDHRWPNNDGIDIDSSSHVLVEDSTISTGDDGVCIKGSAPGVEVFNITVRRCTLSSRSSAIKFGSNNPVPTHSLLFEDILVLDSNRALALQTRDGGNVYDVMFRRIYINETRWWPSKWWGDGSSIYISSMLRDSTDPGCNVYNITFQDITAHSQNSAVLSGLSPGKKLTNVTLNNVTIIIDRLPAWNYSIDSNPRVFPNIEYDPTLLIKPTRTDMTGWMPGLYVENVEGLLLDGLNITFINDHYQSYWGSSCVNTTNANYPILYGKPTSCTPPTSRNKIGLN